MRLRDTMYFTFGGGGGDSSSSTTPLHGHPETNFNRAKHRKGGPDKGGVAAKKGKKKKMRATSGGQTGGSSMIARNFKVVDGMGRVLHEYRTKEEAETASAGNRYSRVVTQIPDSDTPEVRDMIRKKPKDTQLYVHRRTLPFPNPYPGSPQGR